MMVEQQAFFDETTNSWAELIKHIEPLSRSHWLFRGQAYDWCLAPTLQRKIDAWGIDPGHAPKLEEELAREFRRRVRGEEQSLVQKNMLNCLALMQHHGAPTRLLDATYSPFVAAQTALRDGLKDVPVIWCFNPYWMEKHCDQILGQTERSARFDALIKRTPLLVMSASSA
jgi:hypothetical protein